MTPAPTPAAPPVARFYRLIESAPLPMRADRTAGGTLPTRAARYCDAVTSASAFGWYVFPPMELSLYWDGDSIFWTWPGLAPDPESGRETWLPLEAAQFPDFSARFDAAAPAAAQGGAPPFLTALPEPGAVQIWTGLLARTAPEWSLLIRPVANLPGGGGYAQWEGIVETDRWFGPLFTNLRLTRTHAPVKLRADWPLAQVQPLPRAAYAEATLAATEMVGRPEELTPQDWADYAAAVVAPNARPDRAPGDYAVKARRRRKSGCPVGHGPDAAS